MNYFNGFFRLVILGCVMVVCVAFLGVGAGAALAGSLDSPAAPTSAGSAMYTLEDIYNRLNVGAAGAKRTGAFTEPSSGPVAAGHTLDEVMQKAPYLDDAAGANIGDVLSGKKFWCLTSTGWGIKTGTYSGGGGSCTAAPVEKTGQTVSYRTGDDGDLERGVPWPNPRFSDKGNGTVTDNLTGLTWLKSANCGGTRNWDTAVTWCRSLASGSCGLSDGSTAGTWRLPNLKELQSIVDYGHTYPSIPAGHPFTGVQSYNYWSSNSKADAPATKWTLTLRDGAVGWHSGGNLDYVWPVKGGQ